MKFLCLVVVAVVWLALLFWLVSKVAADPVGLLEQQRVELDAAAKENGASTQAYATLQGDFKTYHDTMEAKWYVRWGRPIDHFLHVLMVLGAIGIALRVVSMFAGGWIGSLAAFGSTAIFGGLSGGISLIQTAFDNIHFRRKLAAVSVGSNSVP